MASVSYFWFPLKNPPTSWVPTQERGLSWEHPLSWNPSKGIKGVHDLAQVMAAEHSCFGGTCSKLTATVLLLFSLPANHSIEPRLIACKLFSPNGNAWTATLQMRFTNSSVGAGRAAAFPKRISSTTHRLLCKKSQCCRCLPPSFS